MPLEDKQSTRRVEREIHKLPIDHSLVSVSVINGVAYIGGRVRRLRTPEARGLDLKKALQDLEEHVRMLPGIRDVVIDASVDL
ncbi:MAG: hypothetical protein J7M26_07100 [Armatimonadetes bacterium]|nr:hypothetical protein [Armatimonadota bacterium]